MKLHDALDDASPKPPEAPPMPIEPSAGAQKARRPPRAILKAAIGTEVELAEEGTRWLGKQKGDGDAENSGLPLGFDPAASFGRPYRRRPEPRATLTPWRTAISRRQWPRGGLSDVHRRPKQTGVSHGSSSPSRSCSHDASPGSPKASQGAAKSPPQNTVGCYKYKQCIIVSQFWP